MANDLVGSTPRLRPRLLLLPGWMGSGPTHWQSRWETLHACERVTQDDWVWPRRGDWMARLDEVVQAGGNQPVVLIGHSLGCHLVAAWAAHSAHTACIRAALLVAPPDTERADMPPNLFAWRLITRKRLAFPSLLVASRDDPYCTSERAAQMASDWGSDIVLLGALGHINDRSGLGDWPQGWDLLRSLTA